MLNPALKPVVPDAILARMRFEYLEKPPEWHALQDRKDGGAARGAELENGRQIEQEILPRLLAFAESAGADAFWVLLEGQSMIRLAHALRRATRLPVRTQVMDPPRRWLQVHGVDPASRDEVLAKFAEVVAGSRACATASWAMAQRYSRAYGARSIAVVPSLPADWALPAANGPGDSSAIRIGFAGQLYARAEWHALASGLRRRDWRIDGRPVELHAFAQEGIPELRGLDDHVRFRPWTDTRQLIAALAPMDLLYCPYFFSEDAREDAELCFPSKLTTYLATGRPVLFHGPGYASPGRFLGEWRAGFHCATLEPDDVVATIEAALRDRTAYGAAARNGRRAFNARLTHRHLRRAVKRFLA